VKSKVDPTRPVGLQKHKHRMSEKTNDIAPNVLLVLRKVLQTECIRASIWNDDTRQLLFLGRNFIIMFQNMANTCLSVHIALNTF